MHLEDLRLCKPALGRLALAQACTWKTCACASLHLEDLRLRKPALGAALRVRVSEQLGMDTDAFLVQDILQYNGYVTWEPFAWEPFAWSKHWAWRKHGSPLLEESTRLGESSGALCLEQALGLEKAWEAFA
eukprot:1157305-Pelagomonas_calceolata.AAC.17